MNESPLSGGMLAQELQRDLEDLDLFREALTKMKENAASDAGLLVDDRPRLTLVRPEDHDESSAVLSPDDTVESAAITDLDEDYGELWLESLTGNASNDHSVSGATSEAPCGLAEPRADADPDAADLHEIEEPDQAAFSDIHIHSNDGSNSAVAVTKTELTASPSVSRPAVAVTTPSGSIPRRIGTGKLAPAKMNWKPGDPFGCSDDPRRFRWELMLTTACVTAMCGLTCIWLLRTILA